jgi:hypothetical protein
MMCSTKQHLTYIVQQAINSGDFTRTQMADEIIRLSKQHKDVLTFQENSGIELYDLVLKLRNECKHEHDLDAEQCEQEEREFIVEEDSYCIDVRLAYFSPERATRYGQYKLYAGLSDYDTEHGDACSADQVSWDMDDDECFDVTYRLINELFDQIAVNAPTDYDIKQYIVREMNNIRRNNIYFDAYDEAFREYAEKIIQMFHERQ